MQKSTISKQNKKLISNVYNLKQGGNIFDHLVESIDHLNEKDCEHISPNQTNLHATLHAHSKVQTSSILPQILQNGQKSIVLGSVNQRSAKHIQDSKNRHVRKSSDNYSKH